MRLLLPERELFAQQRIDRLKRTDVTGFELSYHLVEFFKCTGHLQAYQALANAIEHCGAHECTSSARRRATVS